MSRRTRRILGLFCLLAALLCVAYGTVASGVPRPFTAAADQPAATPTDTNAMSTTAPAPS